MHELLAPNARINHEKYQLDLPAVRWKLLNLEKLKKHNPKKHAEQRDALEDLLH